MRDRKDNGFGWRGPGECTERPQDAGDDYSIYSLNLQWWQQAAISSMRRSQQISDSEMYWLVQSIVI